MPNGSVNAQTEWTMEFWKGYYVVLLVFVLLGACYPVERRPASHQLEDHWASIAMQVILSIAILKIPIVKGF